MTQFPYVGKELDLFARARNWKNAIRRLLSPYIAGEVLEVGAGIGGTTRALWNQDLAQWTCLEPDAGLAEQIGLTVKGIVPDERLEIIVGTLDDVPVARVFHSVMYIDVLEHIEDDRRELENAAARVRPGGFLIVLAPALPLLFSEWDRSVGHFRRYTRKALLGLTPPGLVPVFARYCDFAGAIASAANRFLLAQNSITERQIMFWDRILVPSSRILDLFASRTAGKTIIAVWKK